MSETYELQVSYPDEDWPSLDRVAEQIVKKYGGRIVGRGMGFGRRDLSLEFPARQNLRLALARLAIHEID